LKLDRDRRRRWRRGRRVEGTERGSPDDEDPGKQMGNPIEEGLSGEAEKGIFSWRGREVWWL
jgi:hypothetical protein